MGGCGSKEEQVNGSYHKQEDNFSNHQKDGCKIDDCTQQEEDVQKEEEKNAGIQKNKLQEEHVEQKNKIGKEGRLKRNKQKWKWDEDYRADLRREDTKFRQRDLCQYKRNNQQKEVKRKVE